jgi:hypothetical protein
VDVMQLKNLMKCIVNHVCFLLVQVLRQGFVVSRDEMKLVEPRRPPDGPEVLLGGP